jgi:hypothetical protein
VAWGVFDSKDGERWDMVIQKYPQEYPFRNIPSICWMSSFLKNGGMKSSHFAKHANYQKISDI